MGFPVFAFVSRFVRVHSRRFVDKALMGHISPRNVPLAGDGTLADLT
jgi:hypothetical protein